MGQARGKYVPLKKSSLSRVSYPEHESTEEVYFPQINTDSETLDSTEEDLSNILLPPSPEEDASSSSFCSCQQCQQHLASCSTCLSHAASLLPSCPSPANSPVRTGKNGGEKRLLDLTSLEMFQLTRHLVRQHTDDPWARVACMKLNVAWSDNRYREERARRKRELAEKEEEHQNQCSELSSGLMSLQYQLKQACARAEAAEAQAATLRDQVASLVNERAVLLDQQDNEVKRMEERLAAAHRGHMANVRATTLHSQRRVSAISGALQRRVSAISGALQRSQRQLAEARAQNERLREQIRVQQQAQAQEAQCAPVHAPQAQPSAALQESFVGLLSEAVTAQAETPCSPCCGLVIAAQQVSPDSACAEPSSSSTIMNQEQLRVQVAALAAYLAASQAQLAASQGACEARAGQMAALPAEIEGLRARSPMPRDSSAVSPSPSPSPSSSPSCCSQTIAVPMPTPLLSASVPGDGGASLMRGSCDGSCSDSSVAMEGMGVASIKQQARPPALQLPGMPQPSVTVATAPMASPRNNKRRRLSM